MSIPFALEHFQWNDDTTARDWERWLYKFESLLSIQKVAFATNNNRTALDYLIPISGCDKMIDLMTSLPNQTTITYAEFKALVASNFASTNARFNVWLFRSAKQGINENLADFVVRLRTLAATAAIHNDNLESELMHQIYGGTYSKEVRAKAAAVDATVITMLAWNRTQTVNTQVERQMAESTQSSNDINRVQQKYPNKNNTNNKCFKCGLDWPHVKPNVCPAKGSQCRKCSKYNHFEICCRSQDSSKVDNRSNRSKRKTTRTRDRRQNSDSSLSPHQNSSDRRKINKQNNDSIKQLKNKSISDEENSTEDEKCKTYRSGHISHIFALKSDNSPHATITVGKTDIKHTIDTGANVNVMGNTFYKTLKKVQELKTSRAIILAFNSKIPLKVFGEFWTNLKYNNTTVRARYIVLDDSNIKLDTLLSYSTASALNIIKLSLEPRDAIANTSTSNVHAILATTRYIDQDDDLDEQFNWRPLLTTKYKPIFENRIGKMKGIRVEIEVDPTIAPTQHSAYKIPFHLIPATKSKLNLMLANGVIERCTNKITWLSAMNPRMKEARDKDGNIQVRITSDNRALNEAIISQKRHIPYSMELTYDLHDCKYKSKLDLNDAFNQATLLRDCRPLTAFSTPWGNFQYCRLNMGLKCASEMFQDIMNDLFKGIDNIKVAQDDIMIKAPTRKLHDIAMTKVLNVCLENNITLSQTKCQFDADEIEFYGMIITKDGIKPKLRKIQDFMDTERPQNAKILRSFLGVTAHFANRISNLASIVKPLRDLTKRSRPFIWLPTHSAAFDEVKQRIKTDCMGHFNPLWITMIIVDAGPRGVACWNIQRNPKDHKDVVLIDCGSKAFTDIEQRWSQPEKEAFASVFGCEHNHIHIFGHHFELGIDNMGIKCMLEKRNVKGWTKRRFDRFLSRLAPYDFTPVHIPGHLNIADFLSRNFKIKPYIAPITIETESFINKIHSRINEITEQDEISINKEIEALLPETIPYEKLVTAAKNDEVQTKIRAALVRGFHRKSDTLQRYSRVWKDLWTTADGILMKNDRILLPQELQTEMCKFIHRGHMGINKCKRLLRAKCWFKNMDRIVETLIEQCLACQANVDTTRINPIIASIIPPHNWHLVAIDFASKDPSNNYRLVMHDERSRLTLAKVSKGLTSLHAISILKNVFNKYGVPCIVKSDNGPAFISYEFKIFAKQMGFKHQKTTPLWPRANGMAERFMRNINKAVRCAAIENRPYDQAVDDYVTRYNDTPHSTTNIAPNEAMKTNKSRCFKDTMEQRDHDQKYKMKQNADKNMKCRTSALKIGDRVLHKWDRATKFTPLFDPQSYQITDIKGNMVTATRTSDKHVRVRNTSFFKKIHEATHIEVNKENPTTTKSTIMILPCEIEPIIPERDFVRNPNRRQMDPTALPDTPISATQTEETTAVPIQNRFNFLPPIGEAQEPTTRMTNVRNLAKKPYKVKHGKLIIGQ
jgi:hypothetical protein